MKTTNKNQNKKTNRLLTSELINFKTYKTQTKNHLNKNSLLTTTNFYFIKQTSFNLKKILQIIFQYHLNRKKILVVGEKQLVQKQFFYIHKKTNHIFLSKTAWVNGLLSNNKTIRKFLKKKNPILRLIKNPRLIVSYNYWNLIDSESYTRRITSVTLTNNYLEPKYRYDKSPAYSISGNLTEIRKKKIQFFISTLIEKIIKLPKLTRQYYKISSLYKKKQKNKKMSKKNYYNTTNKRIKTTQKNFSRHSFIKNDSKTKI
jgi:Ribosomal protein S2